MKYLIILSMFLTACIERPLKAFYPENVKAESTINVDCTEDAAKFVLSIAYLQGCIDNSTKSGKECQDLAVKFVKQTIDEGKSKK